VLLTLSCIIFAYMLFFADPSESAATQALMMASVTVVVSLLLLLLVFFDRPHGEGSGKLGPVAMERSLALMGHELDLVHLEVTPPCDGRGVPR
jgi:hypothetical protein